MEEIYSRMADRVRILGNGILYGGNWHAWDENGAEQLIVPVLGENIEIRGITLLDGGSWHIVPVACKNVLIEDVNVLGKVITGDGVDIVGCENCSASQLLYKGQMTIVYPLRLWNSRIRQAAQM